MCSASEFWGLVAFYVIGGIVTLLWGAWLERNNPEGQFEEAFIIVIQFIVWPAVLCVVLIHALDGIEFKIHNPFYRGPKP